MGGSYPHPMMWSLTHPPPRKSPLLGHPSPLKNEVSYWKVRSPSRKWFLETAISTCVSLIKQHCKKMTEIPQIRDFFTGSIQNLIRKVKQFAKKYITWLIDLPSKLHDVEIFDFILCDMLLKIFLFY